jgi:hypothetical protein
MTTTLELLQTTGLVLAALLGRAALVLAAVVVLSVPIVLCAYTARAVEWARHRDGRPRRADHRA